jgi:hypothetical protein
VPQRQPGPPEAKSSTTRRWWFRFYAEAINDPKIQKLPPHLFKTWVNLLCIACSTDGVLPPSRDDLAFSLRLSVHDTNLQIDELIGLGLIDIRSDGKLEPHNWRERQYISDTSSERVQRHRIKHGSKPRNVTGNVTRNGDGTAPKHSKAEIPPYPPEDGGNSSAIADHEAGEQADAATASIDEVNDADLAAVENVRALGKNRDAIDGLVIPLLAKCRLSTNDKVAAVSLIAAEASGMTSEHMGKVVENITADRHGRGVKVDRIREAINSVRTYGAGVVIHKGTQEWNAWAAHAARTAKPNESGKVFDWWNRYATHTVPSAWPPVGAEVAR